MIDFKDHALLMNESYRHWSGEYLVDIKDPGEILAALNQSGFALVSHGLEADPRFNYGNLQALTLFGYSMEEFLMLPSRLTVLEEDLPKRQALSRLVESDGYVDNYQGTRLNKAGHQISVTSAFVWQLIDGLGRVHGHAARFNDWHKI